MRQSIGQLISRALTVLSLLIGLLYLLISPSIISAQNGSTTGAIVGVVKDASSAIIVGATVTVRQLDTNQTRTTQTDGNGNYRIIQLSPGKYQISVTAENFKSQDEMIELPLGTTILADFILRIATEQNVIEVKADNALAPKTESSTNIEREALVNLPSNQRNFLDLSFISPRVTTDRLPQRGIVVTSGISINSQSARFNNITIDGLDNNDHVTGSVRSTFSQDGVQEFQIVSDSYSAEFGRVLGGVINIVTRGGSNQLHGELFMQNRNDRINARDAYAVTEAPLSRYQFGATLGGPIQKDRTFFFTSFERLTDKESNIVMIGDPIVNAARNQNFLINKGNVAYSVGTTSLLARVDGQLSAVDTYWLRYNGGFSYNGNYEPFRGDIDSSAGGFQQLEDNSVAFNNTYINANLNLVNETRFLYGRRSLDITPLSEGPFVQLNSDREQASFGRNPFLPQTRLENIYQIIDNLSLSRGNHQLKFGFDLSYTRLSNVQLPNLASGAAVFTMIDFKQMPILMGMGMPPGPLFSALQALDPSLRDNRQRQFLTDLAQRLNRMAPALFPKNFPLADLALPSGYTQSFGNRGADSNYTFFTLFFQDDIRLTKNFIVKAGVRYDLNRVKFAPDNKGNFSPRVAFSYRPGRLPALNLRGAYGIFVGAPLAGVILNAQISNLTALTVALPFPLSSLIFALPGHRASDAITPPPGIMNLPQNSQIFTVAPDLRSSYTQQASLGIDYTIGSSTLVSFNYDYVRGNRLFGSRNINPVISAFRFGNNGRPVQLRNDPTRGDNFELESAFDSYYHAFTASINRRFRGGLGLLAHYTFSKAIDNSVDFFPLFQENANPLRPGDERALSIQDLRQRFVATGSWSVGHDHNLFWRDFQISTILSLNTGRPFNLLAGVDLDMNGDRPPADRPLNISRNAGITPGFAAVDLRVSRGFIIKEQVRIETFVEATNLFNRVNIDPNEIQRIFPPDRNGNYRLPPKKDGLFISTPRQQQGAYAPRQLQLGFRLSF